MIDLTPLEVRKKKGDFRRGMRGYDPQSVDDFLDMVADRLEQLVRDNNAINERLSRADDQVNDYRERERALTEALVTAQEMRESMRQQIEREADLKRREAEADAESIRAEAAQIREREEEAIRRLRARQGQFVQSYRAFLERELAELSVMTDSLDLGRATESNTPVRRERKQAPQPPRRAAAPEPAPAPEPEPDWESEWEPETPVAEPQPMPLPRAVPVAERRPPTPPPPATKAEPEFGTPVRGDDFEFEDAFIPDPEPEPTNNVARSAKASNDKSFDDMLNDLPTLAPAPASSAPVAPPPAPPRAAAKPASPGPAAASAASAFDDDEAELLADVRAQFDSVVGGDDLSIPAPEPMPEADDVLDLVDDVADDEDTNGWMSTLLKGSGDDGSK